eukprot:3174556-Prymnesium_polylepis.1
MAALFAALSGAPRSSILAPAFVRAHARPDPCMAPWPTAHARIAHGSRTNKALQPRTTTAKEATQLQACSMVVARAAPQHMRSAAHDR